ncbi:hypothetical protein DNTS_009011 [Danionella cerebrum]|uniref:NACHT domain-containing protein n=1 Tax=Danionella cerebrum TaxID=2873325 RepID=A0A553QAC7_9TELE|nr:hypothetical protein DNTS_009011 [Danionella translucida]
MIPFEEVLLQVRKTLQISPDLLNGLLRELLRARVISSQLYQSFNEQGSAGGQPLWEVHEDLVRRLSLAVWENWDLCKGSLESALGKHEDLLDSRDTAADCMTQRCKHGKKRKRKDADNSKKQHYKCTKQAKSLSSGRMTSISSAGAFQLSTNSLQHVISFPFSSPLLPSCGGSTFHIIHTSPFKTPLIGTVVPTMPYVLVSPQSMSPCTQIIPLSPVDGTVAPPELTGFRLPVGSSSDKSCKALTSVTVDASSPNLKGNLQTNTISNATKPGNKVIPGCVKNYTDQVKSLLRDVCSSMHERMEMDSHYVDAHLVQRTLHIKSGKNANKCLEKELVVLSDSDRKSAKLDRSRLFHNNDSSPKQSIALFGKSGLGKTTLIQRLCLDWACGGLLQFHFVFLLNCKHLDFTQSNYSLKALLLDLSTSPPCEDPGAVFKHILSIPKDVLIIFDSFDSIKDFEGLVQSPAKSPTNAKYTIKQLFSGLFHKELLSGCTLLIASRPKDVLNQVVRKMDSLLEIVGFSPEDIELYASKYFNHESALNQIKNQRYLFSLCSNPLHCWSTCFLIKHKVDLPSTLTGLYQKVTSKHLELASKENSSLCTTTKLCRMAWDGLKDQNTRVNPDLSKDLLEYGVKHGVFAQYHPPEVHFADIFTQSLLSALHLVKSKELSEKTVVANITVQPKKRKLHGESQDLLQRFLLGLLFQKEEDGVIMLDSSLNKKAKSKAVETHLKSLNTSDLVPARLLELFHCVYESRSTKLAMVLLKNLPDHLSFCGVQLCPTDVYVICHLLQNANGIKKNFSINLQDTGISIGGLKELVGLGCVRSFWAHTEDTISLWEDLHQSNNELNLKNAVEKFTLNPLTVKQGYHIESLPALVELHREKKFTSSEFVPALHQGVPAIRHLQKLEFEVGIQSGPVLFSKLIEALPFLLALKYLDLEKSNIGDDGAEKLSGVLHGLTCLRMLNLGQNGIGDAGVEKLAKALASVPSLQILSLYGNAITDTGAEHLAVVLPDITSLQDLDVKYNKFTDIGAKMLCAALRKCPGMKSLG